MGPKVVVVLLLLPSCLVLWNWFKVLWNGLRGECVGSVHMCGECVGSVWGGRVDERGRGAGREGRVVQAYAAAGIAEQQQR